MILVGLSATVLCATTAQHGIFPTNIAPGPAPSPLTNDSDPEDTLTEFLWALLLPVIASGTTQCSDGGAYALIGAADGTFVQGYRLLAMPATGATYVGDSTITVVVGRIETPLFSGGPIAGLFPQRRREGPLRPSTLGAANSWMTYIRKTPPG